MRYRALGKTGLKVSQRLHPVEDGALFCLVTCRFPGFAQARSSTLTWPVDAALHSRGLMSAFCLLFRYLLIMFIAPFISALIRCPLAVRKSPLLMRFPMYVS